MSGRLVAGRRRDENESEIVAALQSIGIAVWRNSSIGQPDLNTYDRWAIRRRGWLPIEVKRPGGKLTKEQQAVYDEAPFPVVESVAEALALFGVSDM